METKGEIAGQLDSSSGIQIVTTSGAAVTPANPLPVKTELNGHICEDNSTVIPLGIDVVFTGAWQDTLNYNVIIVGVKSDEDSATDGLLVEWSSDSIITHDDDKFSILANNGKVFTFSPARRYMKIIYTNGGVAQTSFNLQTIFKKSGFKASSHRINDSIVAEDDAELVKAVLTGENPAGTFVNFKSTTAGNFKMSLEELESGVSDNLNSQLKITPYESAGGEYRQDLITGSFATVDYAHAEIHNGDHFFNKDWTDLANAAVYDILVSVADTTKWPHFLFVLDAEAEFNVILYSGVTTSSDGTPMTVINRNGNSATANGLLVFHTPTITDIGTSIGRYKGGSGKQVGGSVRANNEQVLTQNVKFLARITNDTTSNNWIDWLLDWYEHINR